MVGVLQRLRGAFPTFNASNNVIVRVSWTFRIWLFISGCSKGIAVLDVTGARSLVFHNLCTDNFKKRFLFACLQRLILDQTPRGKEEKKRESK